MSLWGRAFQAEDGQRYRGKVMSGGLSSCKVAKGPGAETAVGRELGNLERDVGEGCDLVGFVFR